jgi:hypothetical protein
MKPIEAISKPFSVLFTIYVWILPETCRNVKRKNPEPSNKSVERKRHDNVIFQSHSIFVSFCRVCNLFAHAVFCHPRAGGDPEIEVKRPFFLSFLTTHTNPRIISAKMIISTSQNNPIRLKNAVKPDLPK